MLTILFCLGCRYSSVKIKPEIQKNVLKFGYRINYKYEGMLAHSFARFYVVTKFILPMLNDLKLSTIKYDRECTLNSTYNEVAFNEKSAIMKENLHTKYTPFTYNDITLIEKPPITKQNLCIFFFIIGRVECNYLHNLDDQVNNQIKENIKDLLLYCAKLRTYMAFNKMQIKSP